MVELRDLVHGSARFVALCAMIPLLAGAVAFAAVRDEPVRHRTEVSVPLPATVASGGASLVAQWVGGFREAATGPDAVAAAVEATDLDPAVVVDALRARQVGESPFAQVAFVSTTKAAGVPAVEAILPVAIKLMASPQQQEVDARRRRLDAQSARFVAARAALDEFVRRTGRLKPAETLRALEGTRSAQRFQLSVRLDITALEAEIAELRPLVAEHDALSRAVDEAKRGLDASGDALAEAAVALDHALTPTPIAPPSTVELPPGPTVRRAVLMAFGLGLLVAVGLILLRGFLSAPAPVARRHQPLPRRDDRGLLWWRELSLPVTSTATEAAPAEVEGGAGSDREPAPAPDAARAGGGAPGGRRWPRGLRRKRAI